MSTFHKPKVFRSPVGCCICRAKSSSSRFTDSCRYKEQFLPCFQLSEQRVGEICNACVLLVKRSLKLPRGSNRHWGHVVDARAGPGGRMRARGVRSEEMGHEAGLHKIRRKPRKVRAVVVEEAVAVGGEVARARAARLLEDEPLADFLTSAPEYWRQVAGSTCACRLLRGRQGECVLVKPCDSLPQTRENSPLSSVESLIQAELAALACMEKMEDEVGELSYSGKGKSPELVMDLGYSTGSCSSSMVDARSSCHSPDSVRGREEDLVLA